MRQQKRQRATDRAKDSLRERGRARKIPISRKRAYVRERVRERGGEGERAHARA